MVCDHGQPQSPAGQEEPCVEVVLNIFVLFPAFKASSTERAFVRSKLVMVEGEALHCISVYRLFL